MKKKLGILDEVAYSYRLMQRLNQDVKFAFQVCSFSEKEALKNFLKEDNLDVLLVGEDFLENYQIFSNIKHVIVLKENESANYEEGSIYKYQPATSILNQLNSRLKNGCVSCEGEGLPVKIIGVYSPVRRCGKTSLSIELVKVLSKDFRVLYVSMEPFSIIEMNNECSSRNLSDIFYFLEQENCKGNIFHEAIMEYEGIKTISPMDSPIDLQEINDSKWNEFFMKINEDKIADIVVVDFDESVRCFLQLFDLCIKVYMPILQDDISVRKVKAFEEFIHRSVPTETENKICKVTLPIIKPDSRTGYMQIIHKLIGELKLNG